MQSPVHSTLTVLHVITMYSSIPSVDCGPPPQYGSQHGTLVRAKWEKTRQYKARNGISTVQ